jgi:hypothetical protein
MTLYAILVVDRLAFNDHCLSIVCIDACRTLRVNRAIDDQGQQQYDGKRDAKYNFVPHG